MRRRTQLQVSTFPFLAVLLCAMGALILVLLIMDRRSKLAAVARASAQARLQAEARTRSHARRRQQHQTKQKEQRAAWEKKRQNLRDRVGAEERVLDGELAAVQSRLADAAEVLRREEEGVHKLRQQIQAEKDHLARKEQALASARQEAAALADKVDTTGKMREQLSADLVQMEKLLEELRAARQRERHTVAVIPYRGRRGDHRQPLYVECAASGLIFHPDKVNLDGALTEKVRAEVERRISRQKEQLAATGEKETRPYLLVLVRPNGVHRYYELQAAVRDLKIDFGYEFVDPEWVLDFSSDSPRTLPATTTAGGNAGGESRDRDLLPLPGQATTADPGKGEIANAPASRPGETLPGIGLNRPHPFGVEPEPPAGGQAAGAKGTGNGAVVSLTRPVRRPEGPESTGIPLPPLSSESAPGSTAAGSPAGRPGSSASPGGGSEGPNLGLSGGNETPRPLRPARISGGETTFYVECRAEVVMVYPSRRQIGYDSLNHSPGYNPLTREIRQLIARRQAQARPDSPARFQIRFLVHPDGERTYHRAYPALDPVNVPKSAYKLLANDDVAQIVASGE